MWCNGDLLGAHERLFWHCERSIIRKVTAGSCRHTWVDTTRASVATRGGCAGGFEEGKWIERG